MIRSLRFSAWAESSSEALALSSALAALLWVTFSIWVIALLICSIPWDCSRAALAISPTRESVEEIFSAICFSDSLTLVERPVPFRQLSEPRRLLAIAFSILLAVSLAAAALRWAKERTSSATTANPAPASPARAASTAAFRARILVWKAISSISLTILATSALETSIATMA